jgi:hypothetical protein
MFGTKSHKITIDHELYERLEKSAQVAGYSSTEEFILHVLETTAPASSAADSEDEVRKRLQGLGYLD